ncbi:hypothetical protein V6N11_057886 [Hibiscus sabdariffa]|uniref:Uncharacterized protein n=1 Tax=Hibiscus sabdariffa TaxID=183260 RepID=A0ABR2P4F3_9ROSI
MVLEEARFLIPANVPLASGSVDTVPELSLQGHLEEMPADVLHNSFNVASSSHQSPLDDNSHISDDNSGPQTSSVPVDNIEAQVPVDNPQVSVQPQRVNTVPM